MFVCRPKAVINGSHTTTNHYKMKQLITLLAIAIYSLNLHAQTDRLLGCRAEGSGAIFSSLNNANTAFADIDTIPNMKLSSSGESAFDVNNNRYFIKTSLGITIMHSETGALVDTISAGSVIKGIEFDLNTNKIVGYKKVGNAQIFTALNLTSRSITTIDTLYGVNVITPGESTFDLSGSRYFTITNLGITIINAQTGAIIESIGNTADINNLEYDSVGNRLLGVRWDGDVEILTALNLTDKTFTDIDTLPNVNAIIQGESTFDRSNGHYIIKTNLGITIINAQTGAITNQPNNLGALKGLEYINKSIAVGIPNIAVENTVNVFPNPFNTYTTVQLNIPAKQVTLAVYNVNGQQVNTTHEAFGNSLIINKADLPAGIYFMHLLQNDTNNIVKKLIITD